MKLLEIFRRKPRVKGWVGYYDLGEWWFDSFDEKERNLLASISERAVKGDNWAKEKNAVQLLDDLALSVQKEGNKDVARTLLLKAEEMAAKAENITGLHNIYNHLLNAIYPVRDGDERGLEEVIATCNKQIKISREALALFRDENRKSRKKMSLFSSEDKPGPAASLPPHNGYKILITIYEQKGQKQEALKLAEKAKKQGWRGDWERQIERIQKATGTDGK